MNDDDLDFEDLFQRWVAVKNGGSSIRLDDVIHEDEFQSEFEQDLIKSLEPSKDVINAKTAVHNAIEDASKRATAGKLAGISTGFERLDQLLDGLQRTRLYIIGGRTGSGKSMFATTITLYAAKAGKNVLYFSLEMSASEQAQRLLHCKSKIPSNKLKEGKMTQDDWSKLTTAAVEISNLPILFDESTDITIEQIRDRCEAYSNELGEAGETLDLVIIDHILLISGTNLKSNRLDQLRHITKSLKNMAKTIGIPVIALSQLSRAGEERSVKDKRPIVSDLQGSGSIEQDSDAIMLIYRPDYYERDKSKWNNDFFIFLDKNRSGETGAIKLKFNGAIYSIEEQLEYPEEKAETNNFWTPS